MTLTLETATALGTFLTAVNVLTAIITHRRRVSADAIRAEVWKEHAEAQQALLQNNEELVATLEAIHKNLEVINKRRRRRRPPRQEGGAL